jgi:hypothetical protein
MEKMPGQILGEHQFMREGNRQAADEKMEKKPAER